RIANDQWLVLGSKGDHRQMQRLAGSGERENATGIEAFLGGEDLGQVFAKVILVASAAGNDVDHGLTRTVGGPERILVGVDVDGFGIVVAVGSWPRCQSKMAFGENGQTGKG